MMLHILYTRKLSSDDEVQTIINKQSVRRLR